MLQAAEELDFETAAALRDQIRELETATHVSGALGQASRPAGAKRQATRATRQSRSPARGRK
ncbi:MAG: UvrB/UvrC motif-containing protein, partial [Kiritimatiellae bacterium]|nr:UvrB/UvrC motif-containing protein [Kiritimatiellia bacterium]